ncbi:MAG: heavy metal-binding domain-containing protein [Candidatus Hydrogenedentes bacterium]|nr:heavy metal-binding domain-containing protein [Candidatus Hydrogenedentota bacterium]
MEDLIAAVVSLGTPLGLLLLGYYVGSTTEKKHIRSLEQREAQHARIIRSTLRRVPANWRVSQAALVNGQAVIASDYFKMFAAKLRNFFGGEVRSLETLMDRARREATLRMLDEAAAMGANAVWNVRYETSTVGRGMGGKGAAMAEVYAYGTALRVESNR